MLLLQVFVANAFAFAFEARDHATHPAHATLSTSIDVAHQGTPVDSVFQSIDSQPSHSDCQEHCHIQHNATNALLCAVTLPINSALENFTKFNSSARFVAVNYPPSVPPPNA
jgi:hypothetical protein